MTIKFDRFEKLFEASRITQSRHHINRNSSLICLTGPPGVGKTSRIHAYANKINYAVDTIIIGRMTPVDVGGIYGPDHEKRQLIHYVTKRLVGGDSIPKGKDGLIILFDEISSGQDETQVAIQSLVQDRVLDGHQCDPRVMFIAACNLPEHTGGARDIIRSLASRMLFVEYKFDEKEWFEKARTEWDILPEIYAFNLWKDGAMLHVTDPDPEALSIPDPRGWEKTSLTLAAAMESLGYDSLASLIEGDHAVFHSIVSGQLGEPVAHEMTGFIRMSGELPTIAEVYENPHIARVPTSSHAQYAVVFNIEIALSKEETKAKNGRASRSHVDAVYEYIRRLPRPMAALAFTRLCENVTESFTKSPKFFDFQKDYQSLLSA